MEKQQQIEYLENKVRRLATQNKDSEGVMKQRLTEQKQQFDTETQKMQSALKQRGGEELPALRGAPSDLQSVRTGVMPLGIGDMLSPASQLGGDGDSPSQLRRSFSPNKTFNSGAGSNPRGTMTNFYFKQDKDKMDAAAERLIHSVNAVTDLLKANTKLRDNIEKVQRDLEEKDAEGFQLQIENQALRERLELVEGILKNNSHDYDELVSAQIKSIMEKSNTEYGKFG